MVITMKKVYVNEDWCLGCHLCEFTCAAANSGAPDMIKAFAGGKKPVARIQIEEGDKINFAVQCRHCDAHPCVKGCIAGALSVQDGVIVCDEEKCVGCYTCVSCNRAATRCAEQSCLHQRKRTCPEISSQSHVVHHRRCR